MNELFYVIFKSKEDKLFKFAKPSPNYTVPSLPILLPLWNIKIQFFFQFLIARFSRNINLFFFLRIDFYQIFNLKIDKFFKFEKPSPNFIAPWTPIMLELINLKIQFHFSINY
jgi:hypothetical protein